jgi:transposase
MTSQEEHALRQENHELRVLVGAQQERLEQQAQHIAQLQEQVAALQARLSKDSHNSHLPPSSDRFPRQPKSLRTKSGKKAGGQPGHEGTTLMLSPTPDTVVVHALEQCEHCQHDLRQVESLQVERRQVMDLPVKRVLVVEHQVQQKWCPACQQVSSAAFPQEVRAPVQYGAACGAVAVYLVQQQLVPYERACEVMEDLLGVPMSAGTLQGLVQRCAQQLEPVEQQIKEALIQAPVIHQDETGLHVAGQRCWMHVTCTPTLTHYHVHAKRGQTALEAIGILPKFAGISIHDGWASYFLYACEHACCNVHLLRDLIFLAEEHHCSWALDLKELLLKMKEATEYARQQGQARLDPLEVVDWEAQFLRLLDEGDQAHPRATAPPGTRGRCKQSAARNLLDRLRTSQQAFLCFLEDLRVDFDNNLAERDLRMVKVQQKVSGCFRSLPGAQAFARIRGYLSTLRKQRIPLLSALEQALVGHPVSPAF